MANIISKFTFERSTQYRNDAKFRRNVNFTLTFFSVLIFGAFAIRPSIQTITGLIRDLNEYKQVNNALKAKIEILNKVNANGEEFKQETELVTRALPTTADESSYLKNINLLAAKNNVQVDSIEFQVTQEDTLGALGFTVTVSGKYKDVTKYVGDFNKLLRITIIEQVDISPIDDKDPSIVRARIGGKSYFVEETSQEAPNDTDQR